MFEEHDIDEFMVYRNDMDWMKHQGFKGLTKEEYMRALLGEQAVQDGIQLAVVNNKTNSLIGDIYLKQVNDVYWIGYSICRAMARQGYAYEVVHAVLSYLKGKGITGMIAGVDPDNAASIALLKKLNFCDAGMDNEGERIFVLKL